MYFHPKMQFIDLKLQTPIGHTSAVMREDMTYEYRENRFYSTAGLHSQLRISPMRRTLQRQLQSEDVLLQRSVPLYGLRPADLSRKPQRHRGLPACGEDQALSYGHSGQGLQKHAGSCQRDSRLENLRRFCS